MLYALGFIGLFTMGGLTGLFLATLPTDVQLNGTYFIVAHFHYIMVGGGGDGLSWAECTSGGRRFPGGCIPNGGPRFAAAIIFVGFNLTFFPQFMLGYLGMPRRYAFYPSSSTRFLNVISSAGAGVSWASVTCCPWSTLVLVACVYGPARRPQPVAARPASNGRPRRRRPRIISPARRKCRRSLMPM
jgi:heme/copper-type cytochrome/quinol oxidase subunit 1